MDPNANLREQLELAHAILDAYDSESEVDAIDPADSSRLAELVIALDEWLRKDGFLPRDWRGALKATRTATRGEQQ